MKKFLKILAVGIAVILVAAVAVVGFFCFHAYPAGEAAKTALESCEEVTVTKTSDYILFFSGEAETGFIFYPGGSVEHTAYAPLMKALAQQDILCILVEMPGNLAILDMYAAEDIPEQFPRIEKWYIGGHSLGGTSAALHLEKTTDDYEGLVLLASYSSADLSRSGLSVCSLYGTEDGVMNRQRYQESLANLPETSSEVLLEGGNHSGFADYGLQKNDGVPAISMEEQIAATVEYLVAFFS